MEGTIAVWFSNGAASAITAKLTVEKYYKDYNILIVNNPIKEEHEDNLRFKYDVSKWIGLPIIEAKCKEYPSASIVDVFDLWLEEQMKLLQEYESNPDRDMVIDLQDGLIELLLHQIDPVDFDDIRHDVKQVQSELATLKEGK